MSQQNWRAIVHREVVEAIDRIRGHVRHTPLEYSPYLSQQSGASVYLKLENYQMTGSFKLRGAMNKILSLSQTQRDKGVITSSTGNHGTAMAYACQKLSCNGSVWMPENAAPAKIASIRQYGIEPNFIGIECYTAEVHARALARESKQIYVSPYNDLQVIGGQGTCAAEINADLEHFDTLIAPVGGGGLISGVAAYLKETRPHVEVVGSLPEQSPCVYECVRADRIYEVPCYDTLSDATAGNLEDESITFDICKAVVDRYSLLSEEEIAGAIKLTMERHYMLIEGAAALSVATLLKEASRFKGKTVVLMITGCKLSMAHLKGLL